MRHLRESIDLLKDAIKTLQAYRDELPKDDPTDSGLRWLISDLTSLFAQKLTEKALAEGLAAILQHGIAEAGAKLSKDSLSTIATAIQLLHDLSTQPTDPADTTADDTTESVKELNNLVIAATIAEATKAAMNACVSGKISTIMHEKPTLNSKQAQAIAFSMCGEGVSDDDTVGKIAEYAAALSIPLDAPQPVTPPIVAEGVIPSGSVRISNNVTILGEAKGSTGGNVFEVLVIKPGMSGNRVNYSPDVLRASAPLLEGRPMYIDHPSVQGAPRSIRDKVGWYSDVHYDDTVAETTSNKQLGGLVGNLHLYESSGQPWFREMVIEALANERPQDIGISIYAGAKTNIKKNAEGIYRDVEEITVYASADAVAEPGAGGRPLVLAASIREDHDMDILKTAKTLREILEKAPELSMKDIREARPEFFTAEGSPIIEPIAAAPSVEPVPIPTSTPTPVAPVSEGAPTLPAELTALMESHNILLRQNTRMTLSSLLAESNIPRQIWPKITEKVGDRILSEAELEVIIAEYGDLLTAMQAGVGPSGDGVPVPSNPSLVVPFGSVRSGASSRDLVIAAMDDWFGNPIAENLKGKYGKITSLKDFYRQVTGDYQFDGVYHPEYSVIGEALPTAAALIGSPPQGGGVTFAGITGTSMNRALIRLYNEQPLWWQSIVQPTDLDNMKQQDRVRRHNFGSLTERTTDGLEYTELTWGETVETYTPTEYGNVVTIGRRMIINDDMRALRDMPALLARSARVTINEYVSNLFTQAAGLGPALADGSTWFHNANHQGNAITLPLNRTNLLAARQVIMKFNDQAGKRLGILPRNLLVPIDLEALAWELTVSPMVPDSANNARNLINDPGRGITNVIVVPNWTDTNNWYLMADPSDVVSIEMGFLFGRQTPELMQQQDPLTGLVWTNDVISHKVRWDFGGDVLDFRGAVASIN